MIKLSILICSIESRHEKLCALLSGLLANDVTGLDGPFELSEANGCRIARYFSNELEIIVAIDDKKISVGAKRNILVKLAKGERTIFADDDDNLKPIYSSSILEQIGTDPDIIVFDALRYHNGKFDRTVKYGTEYRRDSNTPAFYYRIPNHLMCVKRSIALRVPFKEVNFGEDADYAQRLLPLLKTQERINEVLYEYWFDDKLTETANRK